MILILSHEEYEQGTDPVIDWLLYHQAPFLKITLHDLVSGRVNYQIDITNRDVRINGVSVRQQVQVIWHRRLMGEMQNVLPRFSHPLHREVQHTVRRELTELVTYISTLFADKRWLTTFNKLNVNKLEMLNEAQRCGFTIPDSQIINNRTDLERFYASSPSGLISKTISNATTVYAQDDYLYGLFTQALTSDVIAHLPPSFFPTLFQQKVSADYEIRAFYLDGALYPTAILSANPQKSVDRKLDSSHKMTHMVPCQLPPVVEEAAHRFMHQIGLNTGCIDLIRDGSGAYYFLEINPVGQYLAESNQCNYHLEQRIADWLIENATCYDHA